MLGYKQTHASVHAHSLITQSLAQCWNMSRYHLQYTYSMEENVPVVLQ